MMRIILSLLVLLIAMFPAITPACAETALTEQQAAHLKTLFADMIRDYKAAESNPQMTPVFDGEVAVERTDSHYAITLPHASMEYSNGAHINVGFITINAKPGKREGSWNMAIALPTPITLIDAEDKTVGTIHIGKQKTIGIWLEEERLFMKLDSSLHDIRVTDSQDGEAYSLSELALKLNFEEDEQQHWSGPAQLKLTDLEGTIAQTGAPYAVDEISARLDVERYNPRAFRQNKEILQQISALYNGAGTQNPQESFALYNLIFDMIKTTLNTGKLGIVVKGVTLPPLQQPFPIAALNPHKKDARHIDTIHVGAELNNFMEPNSGLRLRLGYNGADQAMRIDEADLIPADMLLDIELDQIPVEELIALTRETMQLSTNSPNIAGLGALNLVIRLPMLLTEAGTKLNIRKNYMTGTDYNIDINGMLQADESAKKNLKGDINATITGLQSLQDRVQKRLEVTNDPQERETFQTLREHLETIEQYAEEKTNEEGVTTHILHLTVTPEGKITLNGKDVNMIGLIMQQNPLLKNLIPQQ